MKNKTESMKLTQRQMTFCREYVIHLNGTKAYKAVYKNVTEGTARVNSSRLLTNANVLNYIEFLKANLAEVAEVSPLLILLEYKKVAFSSISHLHNSWIERKEFETLTDDQKDCIQEIETKVQQKIIRIQNEGKFEKVLVDVEYLKIKLHDKLKALENINKMMGWDAPKKVEVNGKISILDIDDENE